MRCSKGFAVILLCLCCFQVFAKDLNIAFWIDPIQKGIDEDVSFGIKRVQDLQPGVNINDFTVIINSENFENEEDSVNTLCEMLSSEGISIVIDFTYQRWQTGVNYLASNGIPLLRVGRLISPFLHIFAEFLRQKGSNDIVLILQSEQDKIETIYHIIEGYPFRSMLANAIEEKDIVKRLKEIRPSPTYFAIFSSSSNMNIIFERIYKGNFFLRPDEWHLVFLDARHGTFKYASEAANATKFVIDSKSLCTSMDMEERYCLTEFTFQRAMVLSVLRSLVEYAKANPEILEPVQALCSEKNATEKGLPDLFGQLRFPDFIEFVQTDSSNEEEESQLTLSYAVNISMSTFAGGGSSGTQLAVWQSGSLKRINASIAPAKRFFRVGTTEAIPWSYLLRDEKTNELILDENGRPQWVGYCIDFLIALSEKLNFNYELIEPMKGKFGDRNPMTGEWDGIVGDLVSGETDFALTALKMYSEREEVIDFLAPYFGTTGITIAMRKPVRQSSLFKFMTVLRLEVWLSIVGALVATSVMIWLLDKYSPYSSRNNPEAYPYPCREFTLRESFWFALTSFTPQGGGEAPKAVSGRVLVGVYWLFVVLMLATFTANLAAFLTVERMQTPVQNLEQLARQSRINYTVVADSDTHQFFINMKFAEDTLYRVWKELALNESKDFDKFRIWDYPIKEQYGHILIAINASEPVKNVSEGYRRVNDAINADFAFIHDSSEIKYEITRNCNLTEIGDVFAEQPYAMAVQQGSHLTDELSYATLELQKIRFFEDLKVKHWNISRLKECSSSVEEEGITLESLGGVFIATLFGLGLAMVTLVIEVFYHKRKHRENTNKLFRQITKVKPIENEIDSKTNTIKKSWLIGKKQEVSTITPPPPSFESATHLRGNKIPPSITLGGEDFKPRRRAAGENQFSSYTYGGFKEKDKDKALPPYME